MNEQQLQHPFKEVFCSCASTQCNWLKSAAQKCEVEGHNWYCKIWSYGSYAYVMPYYFRCTDWVMASEHKNKCNSSIHAWTSTSMPYACLIHYTHHQFQQIATLLFQYLIIDKIDGQSSQCMSYNVHNSSL